MSKTILKGVTLVFFVICISTFVLYRCGALNPEADNILSVPSYDHITGIGGNDTISFGDSIKVHRQYIPSTKSGMVFDFDHPAYEEYMQEGIENGFVVLDTLSLDTNNVKVISIDSIYFDPMFYGSKSGAIFQPMNSVIIKSMENIKSMESKVFRKSRGLQFQPSGLKINSYKSIDPNNIIGSSKVRTVFSPSDFPVLDEEENITPH